MLIETWLEAYLLNGEGALNWRNDTERLLIPVASKTRIGLFTDMDGTISPIVSHPELAQISETSRRLLNELHEVISLVAVISGRAVSDVVQKVGLPQLTYVGNHGLERWESNTVRVLQNLSEYREQLDTVIRLITPHLGEGMWVEDKNTTLTVHYRQSPNSESAIEQLAPRLSRIATEQGLRLSNGKMAFEIRPNAEIDKGTTVRQLVIEHHLDAAVYLGDDTSDISALVATRALRHEGKCLAVGIGVESSEMPADLRENADLLASGVSDVEAFLEWFLNAVRQSHSL